MVKGSKHAIYRIVLFALIGVFALFSFVSCDQDFLFSKISAERKPRDSRIQGTLTNIVTDGSAIYAAGIGSKEIHEYAGGTWKTISGPGGIIIALASAGSDIFVLAGDYMSAKLYRKNGELWTYITDGVADGYSLQSIYGADDRLFVGGRKDNTNAIFSLTSASGASIQNTVKSETGELKGAVKSGTDYYIAAGTGGIIKEDGAEVYKPSNVNVTGIILTDQVIAVTWSGSVLKLNGTSFESMAPLSSGLSFTGGMAVWNGDGSTAWTAGSLLLLGVHSAQRFEKGYWELSGATLRVPGSDENSSIKTSAQAQYDASIARESIYSILMVPNSVDSDSKPLIFAATVSGLHSKRNGEWNAEE